MPHTTPAAIERQKEIAAIALASERVANRMIDRVAAHKGLTITMAIDEYHEIAMLMCRGSAAARELHGLYTGGYPTRDEQIHVNGHLTTAGNALSEAIAIMRGITDRLLAEPKSGEERLAQ